MVIAHAAIIVIKGLSEPVSRLVTQAGAREAASQIRDTGHVAVNLSLLRVFWALLYPLPLVSRVARAPACSLEVH
jgi:hypothetical protein